MNHHESSWWIIMTHHDESSWRLIMMSHDDSSWWLMMIHHDESHDSALWSATQPWTDSVQGLYCLFLLFAMGVIHFSKVSACHGRRFCHGSHGMSHAFSLWLPWHFSMPRPSTLKSKIARVQHTDQVSAHPKSFIPHSEPTLNSSITHSEYIPNKFRTHT